MPWFVKCWEQVGRSCKFFEASAPTFLKVPAATPRQFALGEHPRMRAMLMLAHLVTSGTQQLVSLFAETRRSKVGELSPEKPWLVARL